MNLKTRTGVRLFSALLSLCLACTVGCLRHALTVGSATYRLVKLPDVTVLAPPGISTIKGSTQDTDLAIGKGLNVQQTSDGSDCVISGKDFDLRPLDDNGRWRLTSPTVEAWNTPALETSGENEWLVFTDRIGTLASHGCFSSGISVYTVRRRIAEAVPIPANRALYFYYLLSGTGAVDLQPGMQLRIETVQPDVAKRKQGVFQILQLAVVGEVPTGVALQVSAGRQTVSARESPEYRDLPERLGHCPYIRLFLEQAATETERPRKAMLLGASTPEELDTETAALSNSVNSCSIERNGLVCVAFPDGAVSLLTSVSVNGHNAFYAPGTTLAQIVDAVPYTRRAKALATMSLVRESGFGLVPVSLPRSEEEMVDVLVINGDRIRWRE